MERLNITMDTQTFRKAKADAFKLGLSLSAYIRLLINSK